MRSIPSPLQASNLKLHQNQRIKADLLIGPIKVLRLKDEELGCIFPTYPTQSKRIKALVLLQKRILQSALTEGQLLKR